MDKPKSEYIIDPDSSETGALIMAGVGAKEPHLSSRAGAEEPHPSSSRDEWSPEDEQENEEDSCDKLLQNEEDKEDIYDTDDIEDEDEDGPYEGYTDTEDSAAEYTDYENDNMVQYQAAIDAGLVDEERQCWVCFASDEDDPTATWVHPCRCSGTTKWVHCVCIQRWIDEKQKGNNSAGVSCPQCGTDYIIKFPKSGPVMSILDGTDLLVGRLCPVVAGGVIVGGIYWSCVTFGAVTIMQVAGHEEGWELMESADPLLLLVSLPLVPLGLVLGKMVRWQDPVLKTLRIYLPRIPLTPYLLPAFAGEPEREGSGAAASIPPSTDPISITRNFCGALFFPTIATFLGRTLFPETASPLKRAALGGLTFVVVKGVLKVYHKQHLYIRQCRRVLLNYEA